jgi:hypothetical protein
MQDKFKSRVAFTVFKDSVRVHLHVFLARAVQLLQEHPPLRILLTHFPSLHCKQTLLLPYNLDHRRDICWCILLDQLRASFYLNNGRHPVQRFALNLFPRDSYNKRAYLHAAGGQAPAAYDLRVADIERRSLPEKEFLLHLHNRDEGCGSILGYHSQRVR